METTRKAMLGAALVAMMVLLGTAVYTGNGAIYLLALMAIGPALFVWQNRGAKD